jgi:hypothetical protein
MIKRCRRRYACTALLALACSFAVLGIVACGTTQLVDVWADPAYRAAPLHRILVVAMRRDQVTRRMWEDAIVRALTGKRGAGTAAAASYELFPTDVPDTMAIRRKIGAEGFDGVLLIAKADTGTVNKEVPGYTTSEPVTVDGRWWSSYGTHYEDVYHPGYTETDTLVSVRTNLLLTQNDGRLVWSATSESLDPVSPDQFRHSVADGVADQLKRQHFIF